MTDDTAVSKKLVVLLHGLGRSSVSMALLASRLRHHGFETYNHGYWSLGRSIDAHAANLRRNLERRYPDGPLELNFVTHSLGSIVARKFASAYRNDFIFKRAVMLGPPNQGSALARKVGQNALLAMLLGPSFRELREFDIPSATDILQIGIIAGGRQKERGFAPFLPGDNDGIVTVEETYLADSADHLIVPWLHSFLMYKPRIAEQTLHFLQHGQFYRPAPR
ncbi:MAG: lysophospholipase [Oligoflexia bacterium]|nr:lysophospholipase [Oligoflexia bacterium]